MSNTSLSNSEARIPATPAKQTSAFFDSINNLEPVKFSPDTAGEPITSGTMHQGHLTYSSIANRNPFQGDERFTKLGDFMNTDNLDTPRAFAPEVLAHPPEVPKKDTPPGQPVRGHGMVHSQSEGNIMYRPGPASSSSGRTSAFSHINYPSEDDPRMRLSLDTGTTSPPLSRGRSMHRTDSPPYNRGLEDIEEVQSPVAAAAPVTPPQSPPKKRARSPMKRMFGEGGWLGKSMSMNELPSEEYRKTGLKHWGGKLKQGVSTLTENIPLISPIKSTTTSSLSSHHHHHPSHSTSTTTSTTTTPSKSRRTPYITTFAISLSPPFQAKLYSEIELMTVATANSYLLHQQESGLMSADHLHKTLSHWTATHNRPQVLEFMFDQSTQRDLIAAHLRSFRFYGPYANNRTAMSAVLAAWKTNAREMGVRTFCTADSVVKKHLRDTYRVLEMLGAPLVTFLAFQEMSVRAHRIMEEAKREKERVAGVARKWEGDYPVGSEEWMRMERENPFK